MISLFSNSSFVIIIILQNKNYRYLNNQKRELKVSLGETNEDTSRGRDNIGCTANVHPLLSLVVVVVVVGSRDLSSTLPTSYHQPELLLPLLHVTHNNYNAI
jgi:hypothetical protein